MPLSGFTQADFVVNAQGKGAILAGEAIAVTPVFAALWRDEQVCRPPPSKSLRGRSAGKACLMVFSVRGMGKKVR